MNGHQVGCPIQFESNVGMARHGGRGPGGSHFPDLKQSNLGQGCLGAMWTHTPVKSFKSKRTENVEKMHMCTCDQESSGYPNNLVFISSERSR